MEPEALYHDPELVRFYDPLYGRARQTAHHPRLGEVVVWNDFAHDPATGIVTYETHYEIAGDERRYSASARIAFPEREEVEDLVAEAGLRIDGVFGEWDGSPWHRDAREIVVLGGLA